MLEHRLLLAGGVTKFVEQRWRVERDAAGVAVRAFGTCQDITERRQSEEVMRRNQAHLTMAIRIQLLLNLSMESLKDADFSRRFPSERTVIAAQQSSAWPRASRPRHRGLSFRGSGRAPAS